MTNAPSGSCSGIVVASFFWSNATFSLLINSDANSVKYWLRLSGFWLIHLFGGSSIRWTVSHTSFGLRELNVTQSLSFFRCNCFFGDFLYFGSSGGQLGQNGSNHTIWFRGLSSTFLALEIYGSFIHGASGHVNFVRFIEACSDIDLLICWGLKSYYQVHKMHRRG